MKRIKDEDKEESPSQPAAHNSSAGSNGHDATSPVAATSSASAVPDVSATGASVRTTGRVKKPKLVYDPSDNYVSRASSNRNSLGAAGAAPAAVAAISSVQQSSPAKEAAKEVVSGDSHSQDSTTSPAVSEQLQPAQNRNFDTCQKCAKSEPKRGSGHKSNFLTCKGCMQKWHFPCLPITFENQSLARKRYKCNKCRYCQVCNVRGRDLAICSTCVDAYHADCNDPTIKQTKSVETNPNWKCFRCEASNSGNNTSPSSEEQTGNRKSNASREDQPVAARKSNAGRKKRVQSDPTGQEKPAKIEKLGKRSPPLKIEEKKEKKEHNEEEEQREQPVVVKVEKVEDEEDREKETEKETEKGTKKEEKEPIQPETREEPEPHLESFPSRLTPPPPAAVDSPVNIKSQPVSSWSVEQVVGFVARHYPKEANVFRYQDIDGASLLLLTRQDVMNGFGLKLGPALRVFELVMSLQSRSDDVRLAWFE
ncbi:histone-lysine N-methyltransferase 2D [Drosophila rhopaloa]|uniref:Histone-lysine N-methyltransferase 2D n=1 Tax=Drosophila rhopaloa TaxID=1041015 RepID=A0A6P4EWP3_DRORH|nr:histone-lysine N-methyltransferase 2D [Drosophila rhopaloa]